MKQIIEIEVPEGKQAIWKDDKIIFEDIAPKLPESWEEFCKLYPAKTEEVFISSDSRILCVGGTRHCFADRNALPSLEAAKAHLALMQLHQLRDCYRQGWSPDRSDMNFKYCICLYDNEYNVIQIMERSHFLTFQSQELAEKFLKNFIVLIKQAGDLI